MSGLSGEVPREIAPGVIWDEEVEARFVALADDFSERGFVRQGVPVAFPDAVRTARWYIEAELHRQFIKARTVEARRWSNEEKAPGVRRWRREYGNETADYLIERMRNPKAVEVALSW